MAPEHTFYARHIEATEHRSMGLHMKAIAVSLVAVTQAGHKQNYFAPEVVFRRPFVSIIY